MSAALKSGRLEVAASETASVTFSPVAVVETVDVVEEVELKRADTNPGIADAALQEFPGNDWLTLPYRTGSLEPREPKEEI